MKDLVENGDSCVETKKFFLNCLALLLGRLDNKRLESMPSFYEQQISRALLSQVRCISVTILYLLGITKFFLFLFPSLLSLAFHLFFSSLLQRVLLRLSPVNINLFRLLKKTIITPLLGLRSGVVRNLDSCGMDGHA